MRIVGRLHWLNFGRAILLFIAAAVIAGSTACGTISANTADAANGNVVLLRIS